MQERWAERGAETLPNNIYANAKGGSKRFLPLALGLGSALANPWPG